MKKSRFTSHAIAVASLSLSVLMLAGCAAGAPTSDKGDTGGAENESLAASVDLKGVDIIVGSKDYPEQRMVGEMQIAALKAAGANVTERIGLGGTAITREAMMTDQINMYTEYTGTAWGAILTQTEVIRDGAELFDKVSAADAENGVHWFDASPYNNTFAVAGIQEVMDKHSIKTLSDYAKLVKSDPKAATICASSEFATRDDGIPGLEEAYGFSLANEYIVDQESNVSVVTMADQKQCNFTKADSTDPRAIPNGLGFLVDDKSFFPVYNPAVTMKESFYKENAEQYDTLFNAIAALLDQETILELNKLVQVDGVPDKKVAEDFLREHNII